MEERTVQNEANLSNGTRTALRKALLSSTVCILLQSGAAFAQDAAAQADDAPRSDDIVVTATFREASAESLPMSIKATSGEQLAQLGVNSVSDLAKFTPSLNLQDRDVGRNEISIRGVGRTLFQQDRNPASANVGLYYDDVPVNIIAGPQIDIASFGLQRVEVLRGPQGTLFGEGAQAGAIRFVTLDPSLNDTTGMIEMAGTATENGGNDVSFRGRFSVPIIDGKLGLALTAGSENTPGFIDNTFDGTKDVNDSRVEYIRGVLLAEPNDAFKARLSLQYQKIDQGAYGFITPTSIRDYQYDHVSTAGDYTLDKSYIASLNLSYDFGPLSLTSITSYYDRTRARSTNDQFFTVDATAVALLTGRFDGTVYSVKATDNTKFKQLSQELRLISDFDGPLNFVAGAFYRDMDLNISGSTSSQYNINLLPNFISRAQAAFPGFTASIPSNPSPRADVLAQQIGLASFLGVDPLGFTVNEGKQYSGFIEATLEATDRLRMTAGVRFHNEKILGTSYSGIGLSALVTRAPTTVTANVKINEILPKFLIEYELSDDVLTYATYSEGVRNGNVNAAGILADLRAIDATAAKELEEVGPERVETFEAGIKGRLFDRKLYFQIAGFYTKILDMQSFFLLTSPRTAGLTENIGDGHTTGFEIDLKYDVNDNVRLFAGGNYTESKLDKLRPINLGSLTGAILTTKGQPTPFVPSYTIGFGGDFNYPLSDQWEIFGNANFNYTDKYPTMFFGPPGSPLNHVVGGLGTANVGLGVRKDSFSLDLKVMNVTNEAKLIQSLPTTFQTFALGYRVALPSQFNGSGYFMDDYRVNRPRTFILTAGYKF